MITNILANSHATEVLYWFLENPNLSLSYTKLKENTKFSNNVLYSALKTLLSYSILVKENKKYILNYKNSEIDLIFEILKKDKFKFKFITTKNFLKIREIMIFLEDKDFKEVYLFGSYARGTQRVDSDIDIAITSLKDLDVINWQMNFENKNIKVEFHILKKLDKKNSLDKNIIEEGILLMKK